MIPLLHSTGCVCFLDGIECLKELGVKSISTSMFHFILACGLDVGLELGHAMASNHY